MRAVWLEQQRLSFRKDLPAPEPPAGEALVRVVLAGICNTDIELTRGYYPFAGIPGHEFVGVVERGPESLVGSRVVGEINASCGDCEACRAGRRSHCERRTVLGIAGRDGVFAERVTLPVRNLHLVPDGLPDDEAVFTEPLAAALEIGEQIRITGEDRVLVVGDGKLAQLVAQTLALSGCRLTVLGRHAAKLELLQRRGIATTTDAGAIERRRYDIAVDCSGNESGFALACGSLRARGTLVMKSTYAGRLEIDASALVVQEITVVGSRCGPFGPALDLLARRAVDVRPLIHARYPLDRAAEAFEHAQRPGVLKVLVENAER